MIAWFDTSDAVMFLPTERSIVFVQTEKISVVMPLNAAGQVLPFVFHITKYARPASVLTSAVS